MRAAPARIGDPVGAIDSPALVIELDAFERNLQAMAVFARTCGMHLRPHAKTHKCATIALQQMARGAVGVCVQKVGEALALAAGGVRDVFVSNEVIAAPKLARLAALPIDVRLAIAVDSVVGIERLAAAVQTAGRQIDVFVEIDAGQGRCGVAPAEAGALARQVVAHAGLRFAGLQAYHGGAQHLRGVAEREAAIHHAVALAVAARAAVTSAGMACPLITGAGSGSFMLKAASGVYGEIQPGSYVFMDADYARNAAAPHAPRFAHALFVKSQVVARHLAHAVVDAGHKSHAIDSGLPTVWGRELDFINGGDEHGVLRPRGSEALPALGETVWLVPGHCDPTVNLHDHLVAVRGGLDGGVVEAVWPVDARGRLD
ncbi:DSD1 family PLP-dependent enzyme [Methylibium sp.]|uniref:DSD1 family PLP-dependent enzyme n=1 Tax=Methylibium sp. TaxID=2067992 RepID=UPI003D09E68F